jgi:glycine cleavage system aminomethyltransferase T
MGMTPFGMRAMMSLRLDRFFGSWMNEFSPDYGGWKPAWSVYQVGQDIGKPRPTTGYLRVSS